MTTIARILQAAPVLTLVAAAALPRAVTAQATPPSGQNPSPMVETTRRHERLSPRAPAGVVRAVAGPGGRPVEVRVPDRLRADRTHLVVHFMGAAWLPHQAVATLGRDAVSAVVNLGAGSGVYHRTFSDPAAFDSLLAAVSRAVAEAAGREPAFRRVTLSAFSAGHGAVRVILAEPRHAARVDAVLLLDGMHTSYVPERTPIAAGGALDTTNLVVLGAYARRAASGERRMLVTHSEIFPGTFASTTETADWLIARLGLHRTPVLDWGPRGMQQLAVTRAGRLEVLGFAGNTAPDHVDHLHAMPELLRRLWR